MSSTFTLRQADPETTRAFPLAVQGPAAWQHQDRAWRLRLPLPELSPGTILVPSLTLSCGAARTGAACTGAAGTGAAAPAVDPPVRYQWVLMAGDSSWALPPVPAAPAGEGPAAALRRSAEAAVSTHIDCFHVHRRLQGAELMVSVTAAQAPRRYLVAVSARPLTMADPPLPRAGAALPRPPAPRSQMTAPEPIAARICSPTCVSMVLTLWGREHDWLTLARECHDPASGMYGVWPMALAAAARYGCLGSVEVFRAWDEPLAVLERGVPLITSLRFRSHELPGAPLPETGGHLVVVHAASPDTVSVCDPAAPDGQVLRTYPAAAFSQAWLRHRGAAYILPP